ncbi:MAG: hypothetical protein WBH40_13335 [Ignavibacteriaceae bacterium]|jgi:hypothetical protein
MFKVLIVGIFIFLVVGIVSISFWYKNKDESLGSVHLKKNIVEPRLLTIKEIDIFTANSNYYFTIRNKVQ